MYGRQAEQIIRFQEYFKKTQELLDELVSGNVLPSQLVVTQAGWELRDGEPQYSPQPEHIGRNGRRAEEAGIASGEGSGEQPPGPGSEGQD